MKTGVVPDRWEQTVLTVQQSVDSISKVDKMQFSKTDLKPFTDINKVIDSFNLSVSALKQQTDGETNNLLGVGYNKQTDDANYGK
ncbi:hypothetical protein NR996_01935 [Lactobacillus rodentium]|uniref:Uncharacterized protein n=1 Tax=Lactobacillus rodentium TaxID=947835 RepID=A0A2Z6TRW8_9LACO|nr:hypothetical protein [Lactobacillus rodentium]MCR1894172.1 hypothetical protein [Lactobacillus rodentium]GBG04469.1 hypothetical protein LrDSM24759_03830 [Lactobacillus rodentium]